jgi:hypothetical protein
MVKIIKTISFAIFLIIFFNDAFSITDTEYKELRIWTLGLSGLPTARWGDVDCNVWRGIYADCKHPGVDYGTNKKNVEIYSVGEGVVTSTGGSLGKVCIYDNAIKKTFCYLHLSEIIVKENQSIKRGQTIGRTGDVGVKKGQIHLHFEVLDGNKKSAAQNYSYSVNPYLNARSSYFLKKYNYVSIKVLVKDSWCGNRMATIEGNCNGKEISAGLYFLGKTKFIVNDKIYKNQTEWYDICSNGFLKGKLVNMYGKWDGDDYFIATLVIY